MEKLIPKINMTLLIFALIGGAFGAWKVATNIGAWKQGIEQRAYDDVKQKYAEEQHLKEFDLSIKEIRREAKKRDSVAEIFISGLNYLNTIERRAEERNQRQAVTEWQTNQKVDTLLQFWNKYNASVENE